MKFSTLLFAFGAITGAIAADSNTQNQVTSADTIPNSRTTSHASPRTATWRLYNRVYRPPQVRTVSLSESQKQSRGNDNDTTSNSQLSSRSSSLSGSWRVFMRTPRRSVAKIISLEEAKRQVEGGSTKVESSSKVESRSVDTSIANDVVEQKEGLGREDSGVTGDSVGISRGEDGLTGKNSERRRSAGEGRLMARRRERA